MSNEMPSLLSLSSPPVVRALAAAAATTVSVLADRDVIDGIDGLETGSGSRNRSGEGRSN